MNKFRTRKGFSLLELSMVLIIVLILIFGVTKSRELIFVAKLKSASSSTDVAPPSCIPNLALWLDTTNSKNVATGPVISKTFGHDHINDGEYVAGWKDRNNQTAELIDLLSENDANRPKYVAKGIGDLPSINFDGSDDYLVSNNKNGVISTGQNSYTIFVVFKLLNLDNSSSNILFAQNSTSLSNGSFAGMSLDRTSKLPVAWSYGSSYDYCATNQNMKLEVNKDYIYGIRFNNYNVNKITIYLNKYIQSGSPTLPPYIQSGKISIGAGSENGISFQDFFNGYISEVIVFNRAISDKEINEIRDYLSKKYNINII